MKLALKIIGIACAVAATGGIVYGACRLISHVRAGIRLLNQCDDYDCDLCPNEGLCGLCDKK